MKIKYNIPVWCMAVGFLLMTGCSDDDDKWAPGEAAEAVSQISFSSDNPSTAEINPGEEKSYTLTLTREDAAEAVSVPLVVDGAEEFEVPATANFAAGETETQITVRFKGTETSGSYNCTISIPEGPYNSPYSSLTTTTEIKLSVIRWVLYAKNVLFHDGDDAYPAPLFNDFYLDLYKADGKELYRFENFMDGYNLDFTLNVYKGDTYYIEPENGCYGYDYYGYPAWFFGSTASDSYPLYSSGMFPDNFLDYCFLYVNDEDYTTINFNTRTGLIYGYFNWYDMQGNYINYEYPYFEFSWTEADEVQQY